jgi:hypothetical protein
VVGQLRFRRLLHHAVRLARLCRWLV